MYGRAKQRNLAITNIEEHNYVWKSQTKKPCNHQYREVQLCMEEPNKETLQSPI